MAKSALPPDDYRDLLYQRQGVICHFLPTKNSINNCMRSLAAGAANVIIAEKGSKIGYKHLQTCKSVWLCPICADRIGRQRRAQLKRAVDAERAAGFQLAFITYTCQHRLEESLSVVRDRVRYAHSTMHSGKAWQRIEDKYTWDGSIRATEPLFGANGWHYHLHEIAFVDKSADLDELRLDLSERWQGAVARQGGYASADHGLDLEDAETTVKDYIGKWGLVAELTEPSMKFQRSEGLQPYQLADVAVQEPRRAKWAEERFAEYAAAMEGVKQLVPGKNLRALFTFIKENQHKSEFDINILADLTIDQWRHVWKRGKRSDLIRAVKNRDAQMFDMLIG